MHFRHPQARAPPGPPAGGSVQAGVADDDGYLDAVGRVQLARMRGICGPATVDHRRLEESHR
jgi:hypothetical protein